MGNYKQRIIRHVLHEEGYQRRVIKKAIRLLVKKVKGSPYSITEGRVPELIRFSAVSLQVT